MRLLKILAPAFALCILIMACGTQTDAPAKENTDAEKAQIASLLDSFNVAAANSDFDTYFSFFTDDAIFIGTDATEHWDKQAFMAWAKPAFDKKKTWHFTALDRHIYQGEQPGIAWFDELLNTSMKICRGSGVVVKKNGAWKVQQYVLSTTVPNSLVDSVVALKAVEEDSIINRLKAK